MAATVHFHPAFARVLRDLLRDAGTAPVVLTAPEPVDAHILADQVIRYARLTHRPIEARAETGCVRVRPARKGGRASA
jgi:hypothetical protein